MDYGHADEAEIKEIEELKLLIEQEPTNSKLLTRLGALLFVVCSWPPSEAHQYLERAHKIDPYNVDILFWLAINAYYAGCDSLQAQHMLEQALALDPHRADCLNLMAGTLIDQDYSFEECLAFVDKAIAAAPSWISPRQQRINLLILLNRLDEAEKEIDSTYKLLTDVPPSTDSIQAYYESVVIGQGISANQRILQEYLAEIAKKKTMAYPYLQ